jgi:hypothetical protein
MQKRGVWTAQPVGERGESADGRGYAYSSLTAHGSGPSPPEGGEGEEFNPAPYPTRRPSAGWGPSRLSFSPDTGDVH